MIVSAERSVVHWVEEGGGGGGFICMELSVSEISISDTKLSSLIHLWETFTATYVKLAGGACCKCMLLTSFFLSMLQIKPANTQELNLMTQLAVPSMG